MLANSICMSHIPNILFVLFLEMIRGVIAPARHLSPEELQELCPNERTVCVEKALLGECFGTSIKAGVLMKQCKCSCESAHHRRIQNCCLTVGNHDMRYCMPLCGYNTTVKQLGGELGLKCISQLTTWTYCAADANDNTECCKRNGVLAECLSFCKGDVPTCDLQSIFSYQNCLMQLDSIMKCQAEGLQPHPRFDPNWKASCDWDGES